MKQMELKVSFVTPAFLGNAKQQGQWRTPPFKALLRQWWRVAVAKDCGYDTGELRKREAILFGAAAGNDENIGKSKVRLRLKHWSAGKLTEWPQRGFQRIDKQVGADRYLGFGPVSFRGKLEHAPAVDALQERNILIIGFSAKCTPEEIDEITQAVQLAAWFGAIGGRSSNSWGSLSITADTISGSLPTVDAVENYTSSLSSCLERDWASALASDRDGPLVWTEPVASWQKAINRLGVLRKESRKSVKDIQGQGLIGSHLLGYPIMKPQARPWIKDARLPNQLRFKVLNSGDGLVLMVAHVAHGIPNMLWQKQQERAKDWVAQHQLPVWQRVHSMMDHQMTRLGGGV
ncbi:MAG: hypothetical protein Q9M26_08850 [Mariprofundales bacterium]|nr:hypothetical protein [Mariprofundales bacterium]